MKKSLSKMIKDDINGFDFKSSIMKINKLFEVLKIAIPSIKNIGIETDAKIINDLQQLDSNNKFQ